MAEFANVSIGIQARSTSKRFPKKCFELIGNDMLLQHVINRCKQSMGYINSNKHRSGILVDVALLIPKDDEIHKVFRDKAFIIYGSEEDVLSRYVKMAERLKSDYIVRVTGDCPLVPSALITKHIMTAVKNNYDYFSNVDESCRTAPDGHDCEVISKALLEYLDANAKGTDREHVTTLARREPPAWAKIGRLTNDMDLSMMKLSVDTPEDLDRVRRAWAESDSKYKTSLELSGKSNAHRY